MKKNCLKDLLTSLPPELDSNKRIVSPSILSQTQAGPSTFNDSQPETSIINEIRPGSFTLNDPQPGTSTIKDTRHGSSNSAYILITPEVVRPFPKALPRKPTGKQRKAKTTIITETPEKERLLLENMMDILKKKAPKTEKQNLKHVKQIFKSNFADQESIKSKRNEKAKKKMNITKNVTISQKKKKAARKIANSSNNSDASSNIVTDSDSINDISENEKDTPRLRKRTITKNKTGDDDQCNVCKKTYLESTEDWYQCKLCTKWAHETCGIKGTFNYFCSLCH
ncbi:unnamed protein product [Leptosia nina]|uniref:Zinc finger PHD-type domain-containing protein n=1 Tax=Leptosia nina TaxID=320188 RepID=A0AAV1JYC8_9NEOP